jgi:hypothetical protein
VRSFRLDTFDGYEDPALFNFHRIERQFSVIGIYALRGCDIEAPTMRPAGKHIAIELPVDEGYPLMRAFALQRLDLTGVSVDQQNLYALDLVGHHLALPEIILIADAVKLRRSGHFAGLNRVVSVTLLKTASGDRARNFTGNSSYLLCHETGFPNGGSARDRDKSTQSNPIARRDIRRTSHAGNTRT